MLYGAHTSVQSNTIMYLHLFIGTVSTLQYMYMPPKKRTVPKLVTKMHTGKLPRREASVITSAEPMWSCVTWCSRGAYCQHRQRQCCQHVQRRCQRCDMPERADYPCRHLIGLCQCLRPAPLSRQCRRPAPL